MDRKRIRPDAAAGVQAALDSRGRVGLRGRTLHFGEFVRVRAGQQLTVEDCAVSSNGQPAIMCDDGGQVTIRGNVFR